MEELFVLNGGPIRMFPCCVGSVVGSVGSDCFRRARLKWKIHHCFRLGLLCVQLFGLCRMIVSIVFQIVLAY